MNNNTAAVSTAQQSPESAERWLLVEAVRNHVGCSMQEALRRLEDFSMPRIEREREAADRQRQFQSQRHYAGQVLSALCSETDRSVTLSDPALDGLCREAHRIARRMVELEPEYLRTS